MSESPLTSLLAATDRLDAEAVEAAFTDDARMLMADGRRAEGLDAIHQRLSELFSELRGTAHNVTAEWHQDDTWIAEVDVTYELRDYSRTGALPRVFIARTDGDRIADLRVYGANERSLSDHRTGEEGMWVGERWIPPL